MNKMRNSTKRQRSLKKAKQILELKNTINELKNSTESFNSRLIQKKEAMTLKPVIGKVKKRKK